MAIAIGGNQINKAYLGTTEIQKMYLGSDLVFDNSIQPSDLTPIMTNFRVNEANKDRIYFDTPLGPVTGLTSAGFVVSANTVTGINTTLGYIEVGTPFDSWNNNTIKLDGGNGVVYDFTMEPIENNIAEPSTSLEKFVAVGASGGGDSLGDPMDIELAYEEAAANTTYWCKAGDYGNVNLVVGNSGTDTQPVKFIGYLSTPGDITERPYDYVYNTPINVNAAPTISGPNSGGTYGLTSEKNYIIVKYLQAKDYYFNMYIPDTGSYVGNIWEGCTSHTPRTVTAPQNIDTCCFYNANFSGFRNRITNSVAVNSSMNQFGSFSSQSLIKGCFSYTDDLEPSGDGADYHMPIAGNDSIFVDNYLNGYATHGYSLKANGHDTERNLIVDCEVVGTSGGIQFRHRQVKNNVAKRVTLTQDGPTGNGIMPRDGASLNICESVKVIGGTYSVRFDDSVEDGGKLGCGFDNTFNNCLFVDASFAIYTGPGDTGAAPTGNRFNNCTVDGHSTMYSNVIGFGSTNVFTNSIISNGSTAYLQNATDPPWPGGGGGLIGTTYTDCNFFNNQDGNPAVMPIYPTDGNLDPQFDVNYKPGNAALIAVNKLSNVNYDLNGNQRADLTTYGSIINDAEEAGGGVVFEIISYNLSEETTVSIKVQTYATKQCSINYYVDGVKNAASSDDFNAGYVGPNEYRHTRTLTGIDLTVQRTLVIEVTAEDNLEVVQSGNISLPIV